MSASEKTVVVKKDKDKVVKNKEKVSSESLAREQWSKYIFFYWWKKVSKFTQKKFKTKTKTKKKVIYEIIRNY